MAAAGWGEGGKAIWSTAESEDETEEAFFGGELSVVTRTAAFVSAFRAAALAAAEF